MGQEISQQNKCNIFRRQQHQQHNNNHHNNNNLKQQNYPNCCEKYPKHKDLIYTPSSISTSSSTTDDEHFRQCHKYNLQKQTYEKTRVAKKFSTTSSSTTTSDYQTSSIASKKSTESPYDQYGKSKRLFGGLNQHQRKNSQSTDSGIYYSSCQCSTVSSSAQSTSSGSSTSGCCLSVVSSKSQDKQKQYLDHQLYIKSYLDILEEDEKARANYKAARPGGIRNYTPKILAEATLSSSAPTVTNGFRAKQIGKKKLPEDPWI